MLVNASNKCRLECSLQSEGFNYMFSLKTTSTSFNLNNAHKGKKEKKKRFPHIKALPFTDSTLQSLYRTL